MSLAAWRSRSDPAEGRRIRRRHDESSKPHSVFQFMAQKGDQQPGGRRKFPIASSCWLWNFVRRPINSRRARDGPHRPSSSRRYMHKERCCSVGFLDCGRLATFPHRLLMGRWFALFIWLNGAFGSAPGWWVGEDLQALPKMRIDFVWWTPGMRGRALRRQRSIPAVLMSF